MKLYLIVTAASVSVSLFGADQEVKVQYYKITNAFVSKTLLVPKSYFDTVCQTGTARKWVFGLEKKSKSIGKKSKFSSEIRLVGLDFSLLKEEEYKPKENKDTFRVRCLSWQPQDLMLKKIQCKAEKYALLKYIEEHGEEEFRKMFPGKSACVWDEGLM